jgi:hypothetical protein
LSEEAKPRLQLPAKFDITMRRGTVHYHFDVESKAGKLGTIDAKHENFTDLLISTSFSYNNEKGERLGSASSTARLTGTEVKIYDEKDVLIGTFKEDIQKSLLGWTTTYSISDAKGVEIAISEKAEWQGTSFAVTDKKRNQILYMSKPQWSWKESWAVTLDTSSKIDQRLLIFIAAYKSKSDWDRK